MNIKAQKAALDSAISKLSAKFDTPFGIIDLMTRISVETGSLHEVLSAMASGTALKGNFAPFSSNKKLTLAALEEFFQALGAALETPPWKAPGDTPRERIGAAFTHYTRCQETTRSVLRRLGVDPDPALELLRNGAATGRLGELSFKRGKLRAADARNFSLPSVDAAMILNSHEHIFVVAQADKSWRIYQSFQNHFVITQPGFGCAPIPDMRKFLTEITGGGAKEWFGEETVVPAFDYLLLT